MTTTAKKRATGHRPPTNGHRPAATGPAVTGQPATRPAVTGYRRAATGERPPASGRGLRRPTLAPLQRRLARPATACSAGEVAPSSPHHAKPDLRVAPRRRRRRGLREEADQRGADG